MNAKPGEPRFVTAEQHPLARSGGGLFFTQGTGFFRQPQTRGASGHGTGGNHGYLPALGHEIGDFSRTLGDPLPI